MCNVFRGIQIKQWRPRVSETAALGFFRVESPMPTVLRVGRFRFFFFSNEGDEPAHVHVKAAENEAKFWLDPVSLAANYGFRSRHLNAIESLIQEHRDELLEAWHEHLG
jgi:hypothetical protein